MRPPVFVTKDGASGAFLPDGTLGTGGLFVHSGTFSAHRTIAQILVEYAEQGFPTLVIDRGDDDSRSVLSALAAMFNAGSLENLKLTALAIPLFVRDAGANIGSTLRKVLVAYDPAFEKPDEHACDMGDVHEVLYVMAYPNVDARVLEAPHGLKIGPGSRYVREH